MVKKHLKKYSISLVIREMQIKMTLRFHFTSVRMAKIKNSSASARWWGMWRKKNTPPFLVGLQNGTTTLEINLEVPQKTGNISTWRPIYTTLGYIPKRCPTMSQDMCSTLFIAALFVIARSWKQPRCRTTVEFIQKICFIYTMEYYSAVKNEDILTFEDKWKILLWVR